MIRRLVPLALASCGIFHGERVADRPRAPINVEVAFETKATPAPAPPPEVKFSEPAVRRATLSNGVRVLLLERGDLPIANIAVVLARGTVGQPPGVAQVLLHRIHTSASQDLDAMGAEADRFVARDAAGVEVSVLAAGVFPALVALGSAFGKPALDARSIETSRLFIAGRVRADAARPEALADALALELSGFQPRLSPEFEATASDVAKAYGGMVTPDALIVSMVGSFDPRMALRVLEASFGGLRGRAAPAWQSELVAQPSKFVLVDRPKSSQASIAVVLHAPTVLEPDAAAFQLACEVLSSRANVLARERKGYSYGVRVSCGALFDPVLYMSLDAENSRAPEAVSDIVGSIEGMRASPPTERELASARVRLGARLVGTFQSNRTAASILALAEVHGARSFDLTERARFVTPEEAARVIDQRMSDFRIAVVADRSAIRNGAWPMPPEIR